MTLPSKKIILFAGILIGVICACLGLETQQTNLMGWVIFFTSMFFSSYGTIILGALFTQDVNKKSEIDNTLLLPSYAVLFLSILAPLEYLYLSPILPRHESLQFIGMLLSLTGICIYLGMIYKQKRETRSGYTSKSRSSWHITRWIEWSFRPIFASSMLFALGISIGFSSLSGLVLILFVILPALISRMKYEDRKILTRGYTCPIEID